MVVPQPQRPPNCHFTAFKADSTALRTPPSRNHNGRALLSAKGLSHDRSTSYATSLDVSIQGHSWAVDEWHISISTWIRYFCGS